MSNTNGNKPAFTQTKTGMIFSSRSSQIILLAFSTLEGLIALRILLKLIGANPENFLVALIYGLTGLFLYPFTGLVQSQAIGKMMLEISSMFAVVVYALIAAFVEKMIALTFSRPRSPKADISETTASEHHPIL